MYLSLWRLYLGNFSTSSLITDLVWIEVELKRRTFWGEHIILHIVCQEKNHTIYSYFLYFAIL